MIGHALALADPVTGHRCRTQCDRCHTLEHCVEAVTQHDDLLLCAACYLAMTKPSRQLVSA